MKIMSVFVVRLAKCGKSPLLNRTLQAQRIWGVWKRGLAAESPWVTATPRICLHDVPTTLQAGGLPPNSPVTFTASLIDERDKKFMSNAHYVSDERGVVDVRVAESVGGSYIGCFPAGLLTTLTPAPHELQSLRLFRRDTSLPWKIRVDLTLGHHALESEGDAVAEVEMERHLMAPGVRRIPIHEGRVRGALYMPAGDGPFPGVIDMFGSIGGLMEFRSAMLASRGIASLSVAVFAYDDLPKTTEELDLDYFEEAVDILTSHEGIIPDRCGAVAISKNGDVIFSMATLFNKVKAIVSINSCTIAFTTRFTYKGKLFKEGCTFDLESVKKMVRDAELGPTSASFKHLCTNDNPSMIPVEEADNDTHFLVAVGEEDAWDFKYSLAPFRERMLRNHKYNFETVLYPGTGHIIEPPYGPHIKHSYHLHFPDQRVQKLTNGKGLVLNWGGKAQPQCEAQVDLWQRMQTFFMNHVKDESPWYQQYLQNGHR